MSRVVYWNNDGEGKGYSGSEAICLLAAMATLPLALAATAGVYVGTKLRKKKKPFDPRQVAREIVSGL